MTFRGNRLSRGLYSALAFSLIGSSPLFADIPVAVLHSLSNTTEGQIITAPLATDGSLLYGVTMYGPSGLGGSVFSMQPSGAGFTLLHTFTGAVFADPSRIYKQSAVTISG